jgi:hypothetical protein
MSYRPELAVGFAKMGISWVSFTFPKELLPHWRKPFLAVGAEIDTSGGPDEHWDTKLWTEEDWEVWNQGASVYFGEEMLILNLYRPLKEPLGKALMAFAMSSCLPLKTLLASGCTNLNASLTHEIRAVRRRLYIVDQDVIRVDQTRALRLDCPDDFDFSAPHQSVRADPKWCYHGARLCVGSRVIGSDSGPCFDFHSGNLKWFLAIQYPKRYRLSHSFNRHVSDLDARLKEAGAARVATETFGG